MDLKDIILKERNKFFFVVRKISSFGARTVEEFFNYVVPSVIFRIYINICNNNNIVASSYQASDRYILLHCESDNFDVRYFEFIYNNNIIVDDSRFNYISNKIFISKDKLVKKFEELVNFIGKNTVDCIYVIDEKLDIYYKITSSLSHCNKTDFLCSLDLFNIVIEIKSLRYDFIKKVVDYVNKNICPLLSVYKYFTCYAVEDFDRTKTLIDIIDVGTLWKLALSLANKVNNLINISHKFTSDDIFVVVGDYMINSRGVLDLASEIYVNYSYFSDVEEIYRKITNIDL